MERLTCRRNEEGFKNANVLLRGKRFGPAFFPDKEDYQDYSDALDKLAAYEDVEEQGRLIVLPCKVGDTVWTNLAWTGWYFRKIGMPYKVRVVFIGINGDDKHGGGCFNVIYKNEHMMQFDFSDIGKTVFLSCEAAKEAREGKL